MINIYPANRLENLVLLLDRVTQNTNNDSILSEEIILVQSKGMQHWLNLQLAQSRGISMNLHFSLPVQFFWEQIRMILGEGYTTEKSSYSREVLSWRIYDLLASERIINNPICQQATHYWLSCKSEKTQSIEEQYANDDKRFQLACQLADLFEQYLIFRPDWIKGWEQGDLLCGSGADNRASEWQALIWQLLVEDEAQHPVYLLEEAMRQIKTQAHKLPKRICLFGINTLPRLLLEFLNELGEYTQVHFFHLNPCFEYWGDLKTDKAQAKEQFKRWLNSSDQPLVYSTDDVQTITEITNPLLANLGTQGKDFLYLLQDHTSIEIPVYESAEDLAVERGEQATVLEHIQHDILLLQDRSQQNDDTTVETIIDESITLVSAHSALREIQALHDWLLQQINKDPTLTPKDILVMCPNVENYAPYVDAVFAYGWQEWHEQLPPLPCSIADRTLKDSEPLVQAFIDLLELPDSRFQVSQIMTYLRLPAVQEKFNFVEEDLLLLERWTHNACIHWGLDVQHKQQIMGNHTSQNVNNQFTWQQGLKRLLLGFAQSDQASLYQDQLLLADIEGDEALLLGRYFELLEQLKYYAWELKTPRTPEQWQGFLQQAKENLFSTRSDDNHAQQIIEQAIDDLGEYTHQAHYNKELPLIIIRDFLANHFAQAEPGRQFMSGKVTFCSMVPMRSVPFRIIAVLGLNDGEFPRQRQPMGFDLMAMHPPEKGDRSLRGDDRYLFLEALISCRDKLYLSYQGHDVKTNNQREPSLVLQELIHYLENAYSWQITEGEREQLYSIPLQAFNTANYKGAYRSFNSHWLKLSKAGEARNNLYTIKTTHNEADSQETKSVITAEQLIRFFDNPAKYFAQQQMGLYFEQNNFTELYDSEPFVANNLDRYQVQNEIIKQSLSQSGQDVSTLMQSFSLSGTLPDTPVMTDELQQWQEQASDFADYIHSQIDHQDSPLALQHVSISLMDLELTAELPIINNNLLYWRLATPKGKDDIRLWIHHLIAQVTLTSCTTQGIFRGDKEALLNVHFEPVESARELLEELIACYQKGLQQPLLLNASLGQKHCIIKKGKNKPLDNYAFASFWKQDFQAQGLGFDPYINWFWGDQPEIPQWQGDWQEQIENLYKPLYCCRLQEELSDKL